MKCKDCTSRKPVTIPDDFAYDVKGKRMTINRDVDYCTEHQKLCDDAYLYCEYRDINSGVKERKGLWSVWFKIDNMEFNLEPFIDKENAEWQEERLQEAFKSLEGK